MDLGKFIRILLLVAYFLVSFGLIVLMASHVTRKEGLSGLIGGGPMASPSTRGGKLSKEEFFENLTSKLAIAFFLLSLLFTVTQQYWW